MKAPTGRMRGAIVILPGAFTSGNLFFGIWSIVDASRGNFTRAAWFIVVAAVMDTLDGRIARMSRTGTAFGAELDSLVDVISFGVAPAMLAYFHTFKGGEWAWLLCFLYILAAALRLARFNVESDEHDEHMTFAGLPTPAAAAVVASFAILSYTLRNEVSVVTHENYATYDLWMQQLLPMFAVVIALLMVSRIPYPHPLTQLLRGHRSFAHMVAIVFSLVAILIVRGYAVPLLCLIFVFGPPLRYAWELARHRRAREEPLF